MLKAGLLVAGLEVSRRDRHRNGCPLPVAASYQGTVHSETHPLPTGSDAEKSLYLPPKSPVGVVVALRQPYCTSHRRAQRRPGPWFNVRKQDVLTSVRNSPKTLGAVMTARIETWREARRRDNARLPERPHKQMVSQAAVSFLSSLDVRRFCGGLQFERRSPRVLRCSVPPSATRLGTKPPGHAPPRRRPVRCLPDPRRRPTGPRRLAPTP